MKLKWKKVLGSDEVEELIHMLLYTKVGDGEHRDVYRLRGQPDVVVKAEKTHSQFAKQREWNFYDEAYAHKNPEVAKWLAPAIGISCNGNFLIMKRCEPINHSMMPKMLPDFLADIKPQNFGLYEGRIVCIDYAGCEVVNRGFDHFRLREIVKNEDDADHYHFKADEPDLSYEI